MKKFLKAMTAIFAVAILAFAIVGCNSGVKGKTYVFSDITISYPAGTSESTKTYIEAQVAELRESNKGATMTFEADGKVKANNRQTGTWTQDGDTVTIVSSGQSTKVKVNGNKIQTTTTYEGITFTWTYVEK